MSPTSTSHVAVAGMSIEVDGVSVAYRRGVLALDRVSFVCPSAARDAALLARVLPRSALHAIWAMAATVCSMAPDTSTSVASWLAA